MGAWIVNRFKRGLGEKEGGGIFEGGYRNAQYVSVTDVCHKEDDIFITQKHM